MKTNKRTALLSVLCAFAVAGTGCTALGGSSSAEKVTTASATTVQSAETADTKDNGGVQLVFWHSMGGTNGKALEKMVSDFNQENRGKIQVKAVYQGDYDTALNKFKSAMVAKNGPDILQSYELGTRYLIDSGFTDTVQDYAENDHWDLQQIDKNIAAYYTVGGKLHSMPFNSSTPILYYNKDLFKKAGITEVPKTLSEIAALAPKLTKKDASGNVTQGTIGMFVYGWWLDESLNKMNLPSFDNGNGRQAAPTKVAFDSNGGGQAFISAYHKLITSGAMPAYALKSDSADSAFVNGKLAMYTNSTASLASLLKGINGKFELGAAYFPGIDERSVGGVSVGGASLWMMKNSDEKVQQAKWKFIKYLVSPKEQAYWNTQTGYFPVNTKAYDEQVFKDNVKKYPQFQVAINQLHASSEKSIGGLCAVYTQARKIEEEELQKMMNGQESESDTLKNMTDRINSALQDYNAANG
ncbi:MULTISPECIES: ABC transporter substrate-binding protein [Caproicibacterium]|uniref:ABC transporter substrate-binding protein n=1 Tax=Caproicibacterium argilliputei TaxID=3030016 RepID=A0AA97D8S9_9FIRM|nr:ABC transporter substrate-binding protein [Caproicibacterium argilliputei]WOC31150.1 ABC transporter substrate-binding protein [Caproicibacterium argilliputei]